MLRFHSRRGGGGTGRGRLRSGVLISGLFRAKSRLAKLRPRSLGRYQDMAILLLHRGRQADGKRTGQLGALDRLKSKYPGRRLAATTLRRGAAASAQRAGMARYTVRGGDRGAGPNLIHFKRSHPPSACMRGWRRGGFGVSVRPEP